MKQMPHVTLIASVVLFGCSIVLVPTVYAQPANQGAVRAVDNNAANQAAINDPAAVVGAAQKDAAAAKGAAAATGGGTIGATYANPLKFKTVDAVVTSFLDAMQGTVVVLAIVFIVIGGILYIFSAGDQGRIGLAKAAFLAALIGLAIAIAAPSFLLEIYTILGAKDTPAVAKGATSIAQIASNTLTFLLGIAGTVALIALVAGGIMYLTAAGDEKRLGTGKSIFWSALVGVIIIMAALVIVQQIARFFGAPAGNGAAAPANVGNTTAAGAATGQPTAADAAAAQQGAAADQQGNVPVFYNYGDATMTKNATTGGTGVVNSY